MTAARHEVRKAAPQSPFEQLSRDVEGCRACPRLVEWRERVGSEKRASYSDETYWARPVPGFGDWTAWLIVVGLAPGAHGSNRTGRMFTGDRSGVWLYRALHRAGLASAATSVARDDGLELHGTYITAAVRCAPPGNKPTTAEWNNCRPYLERELDLLPDADVIVPLGAYAYSRIMQVLGDRGLAAPRPRPRFAHGLEVPLDGVTVLVSYHPSQQNTFTGKLTEPMLDDIWRRAIELHRES
ncbi:MAG: uracil-DNA glycosylase [Anaerolineae bacterium]